MNAPDPIATAAAQKLAKLRVGTPSGVGLSSVKL